MEFDVAAFNGLLNEMGQDVGWRQASLCPCRDLHSGAPRMGCPICGARGVIWADPVTATAGIVGMKIKREWASFGTWESGDTVASIPSDSALYAAGEKDRIVMLNNTEPFQSILVRGDLDRMNFPVASIDLVQWLVNDALVREPMPTLQPDGSLTWPGTQGPTMGEQYAVRGRKHPEFYIVMDLPKDRAMFHGLSLPRVVQLRKFDLFGKVASPD